MAGSVSFDTEPGVITTPRRFSPTLTCARSLPPELTFVFFFNP
jgi:hypothetical protein